MHDVEAKRAELSELLTGEISVLTNLYSCQKRMYEQTLLRNWIALQKELMISGKLTETFLGLEAARAEMLEDLRGQGNETRGDAEASEPVDFYRVTVTFPEPDRSRVNGLFREMKRLLLLSKAENDVFNSYIANARTVVSGMIETLMPERGSRIYTRQGAIAPGKTERLVLDRSF